jgi:hypothetical protein
VIHAVKVGLTTGEWLATIGFFAWLLPFGLVGIRRQWRGDPRLRNKGAAGRAIVPLLGMLTSVFLLVVPLALLDSESTAFILLDLLLLFVAAVFALLALTTMLFARPRFLVPPPVRDSAPFAGRGAA